MIAAHLDEKLERKFRIRCIEESTSIKDKLTEMITRELKKEVNEDADSNRVPA